MIRLSTRWLVIIGLVIIVGGVAGLIAFLAVVGRLGVQSSAISYDLPVFAATTPTACPGQQIVWVPTFTVQGDADIGVPFVERHSWVDAATRETVASVPTEHVEINYWPGHHAQAQWAIVPKLPAKRYYLSSSITSSGRTSTGYNVPIEIATTCGG